MQVGPLYRTIFYNLVLLLVLFRCFSIYRGEKGIIGDKKREIRKACFLGLSVILFLGLRPITYDFSDTPTYATYYKYIGETAVIKGNEWLWFYIAYFCSYLGFSVSVWFLLIEFLYIGLVILSSFLIVKGDIYWLILFCFSAFSFYAYGVNTIRSGLACSFLILALTTIVKKGTFNKFATFLFCLAALSIHYSTLLPILCMLICFYFRIRVITVIYFWAATIGVSFMFGDVFSSRLIGIGLDNRLSEYISGSNDTQLMKLFSRTGFRWDFLLYSSIPVLLAWFVIKKKRYYDRQYEVLVNTYILSNTFWVMLIYTSFSDRFAYLSWFLYPIVLAYPLLKFSIWKNQRSITRTVLIGQMSFTYLMCYILRQ